jgi:Protein of unknown function (DUF1214)
MVDKTTDFQKIIVFSPQKLRPWVPLKRSLNAYPQSEHAPQPRHQPGLSPFQRNAQHSLSIARCPAGKESNWLPADAGSFNVALRMYWPKEAALTGAWTPPPIKKAS